MLGISLEHSISGVRTLLDQGVQECTPYLNKKYEPLFVNYEELRLVLMEMRSQISGICAPSYWPTVPGTISLLLLQRHLYYTFIVFERTNI